MSDDTVVNLFAGDGEPQPNGPEPRNYLFRFKSGEQVPARGYPAFNGQIYAVVDEPDDAMTINFICLAGDVLYVAEDEEVGTTSI